MLTNPPGIEDIFPERMAAWDYITGAARDVFRLNNYKEIIIPVLEFTDVFARGLGDETDIVSKEMFTFEDRGGRSLTLRPEGTASVVRAYTGNGEYHRLSSAKFFYMGPMFRAERPQRGRLRQFNQFGAEFFGSSHPYHDYEVIAMMDAISKRTGIAGYTLLINSIGCPECRPAYTAVLKSYYESRKEHLCEDCARRLEKNTFRLLDCKKDGCIALKEEAPRITGHLCIACSEHHASLKSYLDGGGVAYTEDPLLVRGLDYYTRTTFEFVTDRLGGQNAFAAGGRYDNLVETFGGKSTPAIGFAAGIERMMLLLEDHAFLPPPLPVFIVHAGGNTLDMAIRIAAELRKNGIAAEVDPSGRGFKAQFKKADRERARFAVIIGEEEAVAGDYTVKNMLTGSQERVPASKCVDFLRTSLG